MTRFLIIMLISLTFLMSCDKRPKRLSGKTETIEVFYVNWACDCANFIESRYYKDNPYYEPKESDCIFIEPSNPNIIVPDSFYNIKFYLRLKGQFYLDMGIPNSYERKTTGTIKKARVFRFDSFEVRKKNLEK